MRTKSSIKNLLYALVGQSAGLIINFIARIVFIQTLGTEYLGLNALLINLISLLSLVELGVGQALNYSLYRPLANNDKEKIKSLMRLYRKVYITIGMLVGLIGIVIMPLLNFIIKEWTVPDNLYLIYILFLANTTLTYFFAYKRALIISDQKRYIATIYRYGFFVILNVFQIIILLYTLNYILFLVLQIIFTLAENLAISRKTDKIYPFLNDHNVEEVDKDTLKQIIKNTKALLIHRIGGVVVNSTDNLIISRYLGLSWVGYYSNYQLIIGALKLIISHVFASILASIGNLGASDNKEKMLSIFSTVFFISFWIYGFSSIFLITIFPSLITIWIGDEFLLNTSVVLLIVINLYLSGMRQAVLTFRDALGLYWYDRFKPIFEIAINLSSSLFLVHHYGLLGVLMGTTISTITTSLWVEPYILFKYGFHSKVSYYFKKYLYYTLITVLVGGITYKSVNFIDGTTWKGTLLQISLSILIPNLIFFIVFFRTKEFNNVCTIFKKFILKK